MMPGHRRQQRTPSGARTGPRRQISAADGRARVRVSAPIIVDARKRNKGERPGQSPDVRSCSERGAIGHPEADAEGTGPPRRRRWRLGLASAARGRAQAQQWGAQHGKSQYDPQLAAWAAPWGDAARGRLDGRPRSGRHLRRVRTRSRWTRFVAGCWPHARLRPPGLIGVSILAILHPPDHQPFCRPLGAACHGGRRAGPEHDAQTVRALHRVFCKRWATDGRLDHHGAAQELAHAHHLSLLPFDKSESNRASASSPWPAHCGNRHLDRPDGP